MADVELEPQDELELTAPDAEAEPESQESPESASAEGQDTEAEGQPEVEAPEAAEGEPVETATEETPEEPETEPFGFTADRRRFEVPGAAIVRYKEGDQTVEKVVMDRDAWNRFVQPQLRDQTAVQKREAEYRKQLAGMDPEKNETVIRARTLLASLEGVLANEESLTSFLQDFERNKELWQLKAEKAVSDAKLTGYTSQETEQQQAQREQEAASQIAADIPTKVTEFAELVTKHWNVPVDQRAIAATQKQISENIGAYYRYATPHDARSYGVQEGELIRDDDAILRTIHNFAALLAQGAKVEEVKTKNQAALGGGKAPPKTVSAKGSPGAAESPKSFKTKDEWRAHMGLNT